MNGYSHPLNCRTLEVRKIMATQKLKILELRDESEAESSGSDSEEDSASDMELTESDGEDEVAIVSNLFIIIFIL